MTERWRALAVLTLAAAVPLLRVNPWTEVPGDPEGDVYKHLWSYWHATVAPGLWTELLNAPQGGLLLDVMWVPSRLLVPLTLLTTPQLSANLFVWASLFAVGLCTWALARELGASSGAAAAGGVLAQGAPYLYGYPLYSGVHERLAVWVFPLLLLALLRLGRTGDWRWGAAGVAGLVVATLGCQNYGLFAAVFGLFAAPMLWRLPRRGPLLIAAAAMGAGLVAVWLLVRFGATAPMSLAPQPGRTDLVWGQTLPVERGGLGPLLDPRVALHHGFEVRGDRLLKLAYVGWVPLLAALAAWRRALGPLLLALAGVVLAAGAAPWNLLHLAVSQAVPLFGNTPTPWQVVAWVGPLLGVAVALHAPRTAWAVLLLATVERALVLPVPLALPPAPMQLSPVYEAISDGAVAELPRAWRRGPSARAEVFLAQMVHEQPMPLSINIGSTALDRYLPVLDGLVEDPGELTRCLSGGGIRWLVVHTDWLVEPVELPLTPVASDGVVHLYDLGPPVGRGLAGPLRPGGDPERMGGRPCPLGAERGPRPRGVDDRPTGDYRQATPP